LSLDGPEHSDPGLRFLGLTGERRGMGIAPRHGGRLPPVNVDHVMCEFALIGTCYHHHSPLGTLQLEA
jgi:hypothetical protein